MNKTYKVARSLTRGTVVTSEAASSRQGKALKMVVAAVAAAFVAGAAMAQTASKPIGNVTPLSVKTSATLDGGKSITFNKDLTVTVDKEKASELKFAVDDGTVINNGKLYGNGATVTITKGTVTNNGLLDFGKGVVTIGDANAGKDDAKAVLNSKFTASDVVLSGKLNLEKNGVVNMTEANSVYGVFLAGATFNMNGGELQVAGSKYEGGVKVGGTSTNDGVDYSKIDTTLNFNDSYTVANLWVQNGDVTVAAKKTLMLSGKEGIKDKDGNPTEVTLLVAEDGTVSNSGTLKVESGDVQILGTVTNNGLIDFGNGTVTIGAEKDAAGVLTSKLIADATDGDAQGAVFSGTLNLEKTGKIDIGMGNTLVLAGATFNLKGGKIVAGTADPYEKDVAIGTEDGTATIVNFGADYSFAGLTVENATVTNNGKLTLIGDVTINDGGVLTTKFKGDQEALTLTAGKKLTVNGGGVFNLKEVNGENGVVELGTANYALAGGKLQVAGKDYSGALTVGNGNNATTLTITNGSYTFSDVSVASGSTVTVDNGGDLTVNNLKLQNNAKVASGGSLTVGGILSTEGGKTLAVALGGNLTTSASNLFGKDGEGKIAWSQSSGKISGDLDLTTGSYGNITVNDELTLSAQNIRSAVIQAYGKANLMFVNVTVTDIDDVKFDNNFGLNYGTALINQTVTLGSDSVDVTHGRKNGNDFDCYKIVGVAKLNLEDAEKDSVSITATKLILSGAAGNVVSDNVKSLKVTVAEEQDLQFGMDESSSGTVNVDALTVAGGGLAVKGNFNAEGASVDVAKALSVDGKLTATNVKVGAESTVNGALAVEQIVSDDSKVTVNGALFARYLGADVTVDDGGELVIGKQLDKGVEAYAGNESARAAAEVEPTQLAQIGEGKTVTVNKGAVASTNVNGKAIVAALLDEDELAGMAVLYVDSKIAVGGKLNVAEVSDVDGVVTVGRDGALVVDMGSFDSGSTVFDAKKLTIGSSADFILTNLTSETSVTLVSGAYEGEVPDTTHALLKGEVGEDGTLTVSFDDAGASGFAVETKAVLKSALAEGANAKTQAVIAAVADTTKENAGFVGKDGKLTEQGEWALEEYFAAPVVAGVYNVAYDAAAQVNATVARRNVENTTGTGVWADVFYTANKAKKAYGDQGYSADIYGGMLGVDTVFANGFKVGGAFTVGTSDADSERSFSKFSTDTDFYGVSLYAGSHVGDTSMYLSADASYLWADNDIKGSVAGVSASESLDSKVFTVGVRADWNVYESNVLTVAPHVGVRYTSIDVDDYRGLNSDSMNIVEMPIGIKVAGNFEAVGFKLTPAFDFTVVPEVGDKKVSTVIGDVDVINNLYNASLGVQAEMGNFSFGVNYKCGFGQDDRSNNSFNANVRYTF